MQRENVFRRISTLLLSFTVSLYACVVYAENILPAFSEGTGYAMPSLGEALQRYPDSETENDDGSITELYSKIYEEEYNTFAGYLLNQDAKVTDYQIKNSVLTAKILANGASFNLIYNNVTNEAIVIYPAGTYDARIKDAKVHLAEAEKLLHEGKTDEAYYEIIAIPQYSDYEPARNFLQSDKKLRTAPYKKNKNMVTFGKFEQDNYAENGQESIEWIVLNYDPDGNNALLISRYGLHAMRYQSSRNNWDPDNEVAPWETCLVRQWLNEDFLKLAFTPEEQAAILTTEVDNSAAQGCYELNQSGSNNTLDKIFILSYGETKRYFETDLGVTNYAARITFTPYAAQSKEAKDNIEQSDGKKTTDGEPAARWWLRSPGETKFLGILTVDSSGMIDQFGPGWPGGAVRPALWLDLNADIF